MTISTIQCGGDDDEWILDEYVAKGSITVEQLYHPFADVGMYHEDGRFVGCSKLSPVFGLLKKGAIRPSPSTAAARDVPSTCAGPSERRCRRAILPMISYPPGLLRKCCPAGRPIGEFRSV